MFWIDRVAPAVLGVLAIGLIWFDTIAVSNRDWALTAAISISLALTVLLAYSYGTIVRLRRANAALRKANRVLVDSKPVPGQYRGVHRRG